MSNRIIGVKVRHLLAAREKHVRVTKIQRQLENAKKKQRTHRNKVEKSVKLALKSADFNNLLEALDEATRTSTLALLLVSESCIGQQLDHTYDINGVDTVFFGTIDSFIVTPKETTVVISYSDPHDAEVLPKKEHLKLHEFVADILMFDAVFRK